MLKALIFDVDGTLADTERDGHRIAFNLAFKAANLGWHWGVECYGDLLDVTGGKERIRHYAKHHAPAFLAQKNVAQIIKDLHASKTEFYVSLLGEGKIPLRSGVARLLDEARSAGLTLAIATTTTPQNVTALIKSTLGHDALSWFSVIAAGDIVAAKKPAADIYQFVLEQLKLSPDECIAFEDSENGLKSSLTASLPTIITQNIYTLKHDFKGATLVLDQFGEPDNAMRIIQGNLKSDHLQLKDIMHLHDTLKN